MVVKGFNMTSKEEIETAINKVRNNIKKLEGIKLSKDEKEALIIQFNTLDKEMEQFLQLKRKF